MLPLIEVTPQMPPVEPFTWLPSILAGALALGMVLTAIGMLRIGTTGHPANHPVAAPFTAATAGLTVAAGALWLFVFAGS